MFNIDLHSECSKGSISHAHILRVAMHRRVDGEKLLMRSMSRPVIDEGLSAGEPMLSYARAFRAQDTPRS